MRRIFTSALFTIFYAIFSFSQTPLDEAVDFTATDTHGQSHHLFAYLDAGKYVMLDFASTG